MRFDFGLFVCVLSVHIYIFDMRTETNCAEQCIQEVHPQSNYVIVLGMRSNLHSLQIRF